MKRYTIQRALILDAVRKLPCHPTAEAVHAAVAQAYPSVSKGTVYRNLNQLAQEGSIRALKIPGAADHFDAQRHDHYHVRCVKCGEVFDVDMDYIPNLEKAIKDAHGFLFSGYDLVFRGLCPDCRGRWPQISPNGSEAQEIPLPGAHSGAEYP